MIHARRVWVTLGLLALAGLVAPRAATACPFCLDERGPTLVDDFNQSALVLLGTFTNYRPGAGDDVLGGKTDFVIEKVLKPHAVLKTVVKKNRIEFKRGVPATKSKFVVFCDVYKNEVDPLRGVEVAPNSDLVSYLSKALALKDRPIAERLRLCFEYLNSPDIDVALDAYREYAKADYKDYRDIAKKLPADKIAGWLEDPKTPAFRYGLYASLLGHCGDPVKHGKLLRAMIDDPDKRRGSGIDGMLAAYLMLQPKEGWAYLKGILKDGEQDFLTRYAALRAARFLWGERPDLVPQTDLVGGVVPVLSHPDMADFAIEDLRKWQRWELCDRVLELFTKESHDVPVIRRAVLRFALQCPGKQAAAFVSEQRRRDSDWVNDAEELLRLEAEAPPAQPKPAKK
ncbi:MAG: hypothetical protein L0Z62_42300 [Gemmataceae bacterium]|nr:hypothetical protein [Gemmataceae bacterium]